MNIEAHQESLDRIFANNEQYHIPTYQRPYAWGDEQIDDLMHDIVQAFRENNDSDYFLGCIILVGRSDHKTSYDVVDGQQRLTTLMLLLYIIRQRFREISNQYNDAPSMFEKAILSCNRYITIERKFCTTEPRVIVREQDQAYINNFICEDFDITSSDQIIPNNESQKRIKLNSIRLYEQVVENFGVNSTELGEFVEFLMERCTIVKVKASSRSFAYKIFSTINNRGLDLSHADILKAELVGDDERLAKKWEEIENDMGRESFVNFLHLLRLVLTKEKAKKDLVDELEQLWNLNKCTTQEKKRIFEESIVPYSIYYQECSESFFLPELEKEHNLDKVKQYLSLLRYAGSNEWMAVVMQFRKNNCNFSSTCFLKFLVDLERRIAYNLLSGKTYAQRIGAVCEILGKFTTSSSYPEMKLTPNEEVEMKSIISGRVYEMTPPRKKYILLKLASLYDTQQLTRGVGYSTIEHILPQNPTHEEWLNWWSDSILREECVHKLGNLTLLARKANSKAKNYAYQKKLDAYFMPDCILTITARLASDYQTWTPLDFEKRHKDCIDKLCSSWSLPIN